MLTSSWTFSMHSILSHATGREAHSVSANIIMYFLYEFYAHFMLQVRSMCIKTLLKKLNQLMAISTWTFSLNSNSFDCIYFASIRRFFNRVVACKQVFHFRPHFTKNDHIYNNYQSKNPTFLSLSGFFLLF